MTVKNMFLFLAYPTFVYEYSYPLKEVKNKRKVILRRIALIFATLAAYYIIFVDHLYPVVELVGEVRPIYCVTAMYPTIMMITLVTFFSI